MNVGERGKAKVKMNEGRIGKRREETSGVVIKNVERVARARGDGADVIKSKRRPAIARRNNQLLAVYEDASRSRFFRDEEIVYTALVRKV